MEPIEFADPTAPRRSGAPEAGGAVSPGSRFGGDILFAKILRLVARVARDVEAGAYRRLRDLEQQMSPSSPPRPGAPKRVQEAAHPSDGQVPIH